MPYCTNCGTFLTGEAAYCPQCGQIAPGTSAQSAPATPVQATQSPSGAGFGSMPSADAYAPSGFSGGVSAAPVSSAAPAASQPVRTSPVSGFSPTYGPPSYDGPVQSGPVYSTSAYGAPIPVAPPQPGVVENNPKGSIGWWILGFAFPLVGLILLLAWHKERKGDARKAGFGAMFGVIGRVVLGVILAWTAWMAWRNSEVYDVWQRIDEENAFELFEQGEGFDLLEFLLNHDGESSEGSDGGSISLAPEGEADEEPHVTRPYSNGDTLAPTCVPETMADARAKMTALGYTPQDSQDITELGITFSYGVFTADGTKDLVVALYFDSTLIRDLIGGMLDGDLSMFGFDTTLADSGYSMKAVDKWLLVGTTAGIQDFVS